jgi:hypothetical protein
MEHKLADCDRSKILIGVNDVFAYTVLVEASGILEEERSHLEPFGRTGALTAVDGSRRLLFRLLVLFTRIGDRFQSLLMYLRMNDFRMFLWCVRARPRGKGTDEEAKIAAVHRRNNLKYCIVYYLMEMRDQAREIAIRAGSRLTIRDSIGIVDQAQEGDDAINAVIKQLEEFDVEADLACILPQPDEKLLRLPASSRDDPSTDKAAPQSEDSSMDKTSSND